MLKIGVILFNLILIASCTPYQSNYEYEIDYNDNNYSDHGNYNSNYSSKQELKGSYDGTNFRQAVVGLPQEVNLNEYNRSFTYRIGQKFNLVIEEYDQEKYELRNTLNFDNGYGLIELVEKRANTIILEDVCQIINVPPGLLPEIVINKENPKHQIIVTPRYTPNCKFIGYEIRYGSTSFCKEGKDNLNQLKDCRDGYKPKKSKHTPCLSELLFSVECD